MRALLLDTNVVSILFKPDHTLHQKCFGIAAGHQWFISFMTRGELLLWPKLNQWGSTRREELTGHAAVGHVRYSTTGSSKLCNAQPLLRQYLMGPVAVAHNGNLVNATELRETLEARGSIFHSSVDTEVIVHLIAGAAGETLVDRVVAALSAVRGAYSKP